MWSKTSAAATIISARAGVVYVANHHIAPGKKQWTWGNQEFGYAWDRNLTDSDGPYIELMAGAYTDNQPDFSSSRPARRRPSANIGTRFRRSDQHTPRIWMRRSACKLRKAWLALACR